MFMYPWICIFIFISESFHYGTCFWIQIAKSASGQTLVIHGSMEKYPWNLDMMVETFTHVHGCTLILLCKSTGLWKQDGFP